MTWFKVDDAFWSHPKVIDLSAEAVALWVRGGSYSAKHLTDGVVTNGAIRMLGYTRDAAVELVHAGLWDADGPDWVFHDWLDYQPTRESVEAEREAARERMKRVRANKPRTFGGSSATPTRPDPTPSSKELGGPLSPFCRYHPDGTDKPCKGCANSRLKYEHAKGQEKAKPTPTPKRDGDCTLHNWPMPCPKCEESS